MDVCRGVTDLPGFLAFSGGAAKNGHCQGNPWSSSWAPPVWPQRPGAGEDPGDQDGRGSQPVSSHAGGPEHQPPGQQVTGAPGALGIGERGVQKRQVGSDPFRASSQHQKILLRKFCILKMIQLLLPIDKSKILAEGRAQAPQASLVASPLPAASLTSLSRGDLRALASLGSLAQVSTPFPISLSQCNWGCDPSAMHLRVQPLRPRTGLDIPIADPSPAHPHSEAGGHP